MTYESDRVEVQHEEVDNGTDVVVLLDRAVIARFHGVRRGGFDNMLGMRRAQTLGLQLAAVLRRDLTAKPAR